jgi:hypothetical protein
VAYSDPSALNATSIRIDHHLNKKIALFARYSHAPSYSATRFWEELAYNYANTDTITAGATIFLAPTKVNEFRANWSRNSGSVINDLTNFAGAVPSPTSILFPSWYSPKNGQTAVIFSCFDFDMDVREGSIYSNVQRQLNFVDTFSWSVGVHQVKFGIDYRRLNTAALEHTGDSFFPAGFQELAAGTVSEVLVGSAYPFSVKLNNY